MELLVGSIDGVRLALLLASFLRMLLRLFPLHYTDHPSSPHGHFGDFGAQDA